MKGLGAARLFALAGVVALAACGDGDSTGPGDGSLVGTWAVLSIDGNNLPWTETFSDPQFGTCIFTLTDMELTFRSNQTYSGRVQSTSGCNGENEDFDEPAAGTYRTSGNKLFLVNSDDPSGEEGELEFSFSGSNRLTLRDRSDGENTVFVLERR